MKLHELLKDYRKSKGVTQTHISKLTGISNKMLSETENGLVRLRAEEFLKICQALEVKPNFFMEKLLENDSLKNNS